MRPFPVLLAALPAAALAVVSMAASQRSGAALAGPPAERQPVTSPPTQPTPKPPAQPVVVELFSSEGCSRARRERTASAGGQLEQPVAGAEVLALELHVDYWNSLGWPDPFSSAAFTARQRAYADAFGQRGVYTPQLVVDGAVELVGSNDAGARAAVAAAAREAKTKVLVTRTGDRVSIAVTDPNDNAGAADVWLAVTEDGLSTAVPRGENRGATLAHGPVVRTLDRVQELAAGTRGPVVKEVEVAVRPAWRREALRAVAFVQRRGSLRITGAGAVSLR
jgi:hypothetical protein